jgi:hypothetical protein
MSTKDGACSATGRRGGGGSTAKPGDRALGHKLILVLIGLVVMSAVMAPTAGTALASPPSISPPPPSGPTTPQSLRCIVKNPVGNDHVFHPLVNLPDSAQTPQILDFDRNGVALAQFVVMTGKYNFAPARRYTTPLGSLTDPLFARFDPDSTSPRPNLGLNRLAFYSGPTWRKRVVLRNDAECRHLPG